MTTMLWLQAAGCGGCTMSLLCAESPGLPDLLADAGIRLLWHPALSLETGAEARALLEEVAEGRVTLDILCVEGAIARGPGGTGRFQMMSGTGQSMLHWVDRIARVARSVVAVGTCAAYGGFTAAGGTRPMPSACNMTARGQAAFWARTGAVAQVPR
jgi:Ni,Fe-hydrogenase I small subunit